MSTIDSENLWSFLQLLEPPYDSKNERKRNQMYLLLRYSSFGVPLEES